LALANSAAAPQEFVQAEYRRGQAQGDIYVSKSEIRTGSIDQMSREDVERELDRIRGNFEPVIDITPVKVEEQGSETSVEEPGIGIVEADIRGSDEDGEKN